MTRVTVAELDAKLKEKEWDNQDALLCRNDLKYLCRDRLGMSDWDECHDRLMQWKYDHRDRRFKMYLMPRGFLKSSLLTVGETIQQILNNFNVRVLISSETNSNAKTFLYETKQYLADKSTLPLLFGEFKSKDESWTDSKIIINQRKKPNKSPTIGTSGVDQVTTSQHYDIIKADDLVSRDTVNTAEQIQKIINHIRDLHNILEPDGLMDIIGTRWDNQDAYEWVLQELTKMELGDERFAVYSVGPLNELGQPSFPRKFSLQVLAHLKIKLGSYLYSCNIENNPTSPTNRIFQPPMRYWDSLPEEVSHVITVDPAISKRDDSCDAVVIDSCESRSGQVFAVDYTTFKGENKHPSRIIDKIVEYHLRYGTSVCGIEAVGYQEVLCTLLIDELKKRGLKMDVVPIHQSDDKARRIICLQPLWERNDMLLKRGMAELEEQIEKFRKPIVAACDILDALAMRFQIPEENKVFKNAVPRRWIHPAHVANPRLKNPYDGKALPEKDWVSLQARRGFKR